MKLFNLFPRFMEMSSPEREQFVRSYRERRSLELERNLKTKKDKAPGLSLEEKNLLKRLGIKQKDLIILKEAL